ncbi:MAG: hypothetical protein M1812_004054 [Candelaria pacifica]|nr:MAG: hypothetical protein M1812_004054 [Candelaria pacifica]
MASWKAAMLFAPTIAATFAIPPPLAIEGNSELRGLGSPIIALHEPSASIKFLVDCPHCFDDGPDKEANELVFDIQALASDRACGFASSIKVNGDALAQHWDGTTAHGSGTSRVRRGDHPELYDLSASWNTTCLFDPVSSDGGISNGEATAQVLTFAIHKVDGKELRNIPGFTISYKQTQKAELIRLEPLLVPSASYAETAEEWRNPPSNLRLSLTHHTDALQEDNPDLEEQVGELRRLKNDAKALQGIIDEKEAALQEAFEKEVSDIREDIRQCDGIQCVVEAIYRKAHGALRSMFVKFRPTHHHSPVPTIDDPGRWQSLWPWSKPQYRKLHHSSESYASSSPHIAQHGIAGQAPSRIENWSPPASTISALEVPEPQSISSHHLFRPESNEPPRDIVYESALVAFQVVAATLGLIGLFMFVRRRCIDPRRRAERLARREERENTRSFRRAARRQAWRNWWQRRQGTSDDEEKRRLIIEQEAVLENAMQAEIRQLHHAHSVVSSIVTAEEGRVPVFRVQRQNSLPDYRSESGETEPPAYDDYDESGLAVADGFQYTRPGTVEYTPGGSDWTPESSVVDTSPRSSDCGSVRDASE